MAYWQPKDVSELAQTDFEHTNGICNICGNPPEVHHNNNGHITCPAAWLRPNTGEGVDTTNINKAPAGCTCEFEAQGYHSHSCAIYPAWYDEELESLKVWWAAYPNEVPCKCDPFEVAKQNEALAGTSEWISGEPCGHKRCPFTACPLGTCLPQCLQVAYAFEEDVTSKGSSSYCHCPCHG